MIVNKFIKLIKSYDSLITQISVSTGFLIIFIFLYISIFSNPFTSKEHSIYVEDQYKIPSKSDILRDYFNDKIYKVKDLDPSAYYIIFDTTYISEGIVDVYDSWYDNLDMAEEDDGAYYDIAITDLMDEDVHPLPYFSKSVTDDDIFILGTNKQGSRPKETLNEIVLSFKNTLYLTLFSVFGFLFFGLLLGIINGYYKYKRFSIIFSLLQKTIESVPLLLWVLMSCLMVNLFVHSSESNYQIYEWPIIYILFGIFSSTALSKLITEKIDSLREQEFVVALKLLGLADYKIIFNHIIRFYCSDIIILQLINIIAQSIFLNITLCIIHINNGLLSDTIGMVFYSAFYDSQGLDTLIIVSSIIYFIMNSLFYTATYLKGKK